MVTFRPSLAVVRAAASGQVSHFAPKPTVSPQPSSGTARTAHSATAGYQTHLRGPGRVLRSKSLDMVRQEIYGYLLTRYAISALICRATTESGIDPDRVKFLRTVRIVRRRVADPAASSPEPETITRGVTADITRKRNLNRQRRHRSFGPAG
jgi:hypothetical protein